MRRISGLGQIKVFGSLWTSSTPNWFGTTF